MKINLKKILFILFELSLIFLILQQNIFPSEMTFITLALTIIFGSLIMMSEKKIYLNPYLLSFLLFFCILIINCILGQYTGKIIERIVLLLMQFLSSLCIYNYLVQVNNPQKFMKLYIITSIISLAAIILLVGPENAISSRLGHNGSGAIVSYYLLGTPIYKSSNGTANFCSIATLFLIYFIQEKKYKKINYLFAIFLAIGVILCGSRKGLLTIGIFIIYFLFFKQKGLNMKKITLFALMPIICFVLLFKIPIVYNAIGIRVESIILNIFNQENKLDGNSYLKRQEISDTAIEWIKRKPLIGNGINKFTTTIGYGAENNLLQIMVDVGLLGTIIYYSFAFSLFKNIIKNKRKSKLISLFSILIIAILIQDYGSVTYSWQHMTMWYSVFYMVVKSEKNKLSEIEV